MAAPTQRCRGKFSKSERRWRKKQSRSKHTLRRLDNLDASDGPTNILCVNNGGLDSCVSREQIEDLFHQHGSVEDVIMLPRRPYSFVCFSRVLDAEMAYSKLNGKKLQDGGKLYIFYVKEFISNFSVPSSLVPTIELPSGLILRRNFISEDYEQRLIDSVEWQQENTETGKTLKHRKVKHYGFEFKYGSNSVDSNNPLQQSIPEICDQLLRKIQLEGLVCHWPDQLTVNQYEPGQGIPAHIDAPSAFEDGLISLSLGSQVVMDFSHPNGCHLPVLLLPRSLLVMSGESRYIWSHGITPRKSDIMPALDKGLTLLKRGTRTSFTFRKLTNSTGDVKASKTDTDSSTILAHGAFCSLAHGAANLPTSETEAVQLENTHVHQVYNEIADHFSKTRHTAWPKISEFLQGLPCGSLLADIGCGNGKYLGVNKSIYTIGIDRSANLVKICWDRNFQVLVGDMLTIGLRSDIFDGCICIAVIHHLSTESRRLQALKELVRILQPGGNALVYVWALEQERHKKQSKYLRKKKGEVENPANIAEYFREAADKNNDSSDRCWSKNFGTFNSCQLEQNRENRVGDRCEWCISQKELDYDSELGAKMAEKCQLSTEGKSQVKLPVEFQSQALAVHTNKTEFKQQDLLVPWTLKSKTNLDEGALNSVGNIARVSSVYHRYYHVFQKGELEALCQGIPDAEIVKSYYDEGNWCVILRKIYKGDCLMDSKERNQEL